MSKTQLEHRQRDRHFVRVALAFIVFFVTGAGVAQNSDTRISLEEPATGGVYTGISNLRGWAVSDSGIERIEVYIDGRYVYDVPMGGLREDVGDAFPDYPDSERSGFSMAFNYKSLFPGSHTITVRAYSESGDFTEDENTFNTSRFISEFIPSRESIDFSTATSVLLVDNQTVLFEGIVVEDRTWDIQLSWDTATQGMQIVDISGGQPAANCENFSGVWSGNLSGTQTATGGGYQETNNYVVPRSISMSQNGCDIVVQIDTPDYLPIAGSAANNRLSVSGVPFTTTVFENDFEDFLFANGLVGVANAASIVLEATALLNGGTLQLEGEITARGTVNSGGQVFSFEYTDSFRGNLAR